MSVGAQVHVGKGGTFDCEGLSFGGFAMIPEASEGPAQVIITVWGDSPGEHDYRLSVGESFEFAGQTWRLDEIDDSSHRWYATLTRIA